MPFLTSVKIFMSAEALETCCRRFQLNWPPTCEECVSSVCLNCKYLCNVLNVIRH